MIEVLYIATISVIKVSSIAIPSIHYSTTAVSPKTGVKLPSTVCPCTLPRCRWRSYSLANRHSHPVTKQVISLPVSSYPVPAISSITLTLLVILFRSFLTGCVCHNSCRCKTFLYPNALPQPSNPHTKGLTFSCAVRT